MKDFWVRVVDDVTPTARFSEGKGKGRVRKYASRKPRQGERVHVDSPVRQGSGQVLEGPDEEMVPNHSVVMMDGEGGVDRIFHNRSLKRDDGSQYGDPEDYDEYEIRGQKYNLTTGVPPEVAQSDDDDEEYEAPAQRTPQLGDQVVRRVLGKDVTGAVLANQGSRSDIYTPSGAVRVRNTDLRDPKNHQPYDYAEGDEDDTPPPPRRRRTPQEGDRVIRRASHGDVRGTVTRNTGGTSHVQDDSGHSGGMNRNTSLRDQKNHQAYDHTEEDDTPPHERADRVRRRLTVPPNPRHPRDRPRGGMTDAEVRGTLAWGRDDEDVLAGNYAEDEEVPVEDDVTPQPRPQAPWHPPPRTDRDSPRAVAGHPPPRQAGHDARGGAEDSHPAAGAVGRA